jgi:hypothetical protein
MMKKFHTIISLWFFLELIVGRIRGPFSIFWIRVFAKIGFFKNTKYFPTFFLLFFWPLETVFKNSFFLPFFFRYTIMETFRVSPWIMLSCDRPRTVTVERGPKREKWWDGCGALVSLDSKLTKINVDHRQTQSGMKDVDDVWWCGTP